MKKKIFVSAILTMSVLSALSLSSFASEPASAYKYVTGQTIGSMYENDTEDKTGYSYLAGTDAEADSADKSVETSNYSYISGQKRSKERNDLYAQAEQLPEDERDAFLAGKGIGETPYSEEAATAYGYVTGQKIGSSYRKDDTENKNGYSYLDGQKRGSSYHQE